jgi:hypothetical protein
MAIATADASALSRWATFLRERTPLPPLLAIAFAQSQSAQTLVTRDPSLLRALLTALPLVALLILMRLMDEVKDHQKDAVAHPERPLPRGLIPIAEARRVVTGLVAALAALAPALWIVAGPVPALLYALCVAWVFLMYREFFAPALLARNAFFYALTHQVIVLPMYFYAAAMAEPTRGFDMPVVWFALTGLGASFAYEVARKLDPAASPILGTYRVRHGTVASTAVIVVALLLVAVAAWPIGVHWIVWPFVLLTALLLPVSLRDARRWRWVEGAAALLAFAQMLAPALVHWLGGRA